ncbi:putative 2og-fe oxygenase family protein [Chaetomidium leptoderma]|uniref:2og-fe oxygenase family protein n=1 Tax=Chaetomidium leptoderma TaxID=669021 RepID=A0AAN6VMH4_9PEZI|nr:putative 2og-fe oxygenase family protein [Chaetomidium leptoderma]
MDAPSNQPPPFQELDDDIIGDEEEAQFTDGSAGSYSDSSSDNAGATSYEKTVEKYNEETANLLSELRDTMETSRKDFVFACGGSITIAATPEATAGATAGDTTGDTPGDKEPADPSSPPVTLRWDPPDPLKPASKCKLDFPLPAGPEQPQPGVEGLVADMDKASFGLRGEDVFDETCRRAQKLDASQFSTNFCPYDVGIMDTITRVLVPSLGTDRTARAELYKLNVYEGASGFFRAHVDTPRSPSQFGSLVVCLPAQHSGGELEVRHNGKTMTFDWSSATTDSIQWAAFYSDCEHEVLEVRAGHRVTLTYNLYAVAASPNPARPTDLSFPLLQHMNTLLSNPSFMPSGGYLGFYSTHAYPHTSLNFSLASLKGIDTVIFQGFQSLGCGVCLRPVLKPSAEDEDFYTPTVGKYLPMREVRGEIGSSMVMELVLGYWGEDGIAFGDVEWLNEPQHLEMQLAYTVHGNQATTVAQYSWCAILVGVGGYDQESGERLRLETTFREEIFEGCNDEE